MTTTKQITSNASQTSVSLRTDGIVEVSITATEIFGAASVEALEDQARSFFTSTPLPILIKMDEAALVDYEALRVCNDKRTVDCKIAEAYVLSNLAQRIVFNFYLKQLKPAVPTRTFSSEETAVQWLNTLVA